MHRSKRVNQIHRLVIFEEKGYNITINQLEEAVDEKRNEMVNVHADCFSRCLRVRRMLQIEKH